MRSGCVAARIHQNLSLRAEFRESKTNRFLDTASDTGGLPNGFIAAHTRDVLMELLTGTCAFAAGATATALFFRQRQQLALARFAAEKSAELAVAEAQRAR